MKLEIELRCAGERSLHHIEFAPPASDTQGSKLALVIDGVRTEADLAEIAPGVFTILIGRSSYPVEVSPAAGADGDATFIVQVAAKTFEIKVRDPRRRTRSQTACEHEGPQELVAPMPGRVVRVLVAENQEVRADDGLVVIEAMKMQSELRALRAGRVEKIYVAEGAGVESGAKLIRIA